ncbi:unnamed protein product, partial [Callosobruchus maculatus]
MHRFHEGTELTQDIQQRVDNGMPYFKDIVSAKFEKGSTNFLYKTDSDDMSYKVSEDVLKKTLKLIFPAKSEAPRSNPKTNEDCIISALVLKIKNKRRPFWFGLLKNDSAKDLYGIGNNPVMLITEISKMSTFMVLFL